MGSLLVVTGPPGSGKSTVAAMLAEQAGPGALIEGDRFFAFLARDAIPPWLPESHEQNTVVTSAAGAATGRFADGGFHTVYDGIVGPWFLTTFGSATGLTAFDYVVLLPDVETCVARVSSRTGHDFRDEDAARKMHEEFARASVPARHVLTLGSDSVGEVVDQIAEARAAGALQVRTDARDQPTI
ncbi:AAA family ATPase [Actinospongicola halichondriae]|uniref:AAA family ATPase n=1 Tax=Actinospongicola halichondriae TaxID=3236844 RepID=UPI003D419CD0